MLVSIVQQLNLLNFQHTDMLKIVNTEIVKEKKDNNDYYLLNFIFFTNAKSCILFDFI